jgi:hypothetical protein
MRDSATREKGLTRFGWEHTLILDQSLNPGEDIVDVLRCRKLHSLPVGIDPSVVHPEIRQASASRRWLPSPFSLVEDSPWSSRHGRIILDGAELGDDRVEEVEVVEEVDDYERASEEERSVRRRRRTGRGRQWEWRRSRRGVRKRSAH